jgi:hypothetical protein
MEISNDSNPNFFKHVFNFNDDSKSEMLNISQYSIIALVPVVILNKIMQKYVPEAEDTKSSLEILAEIIIQIFGMFFGLLIIHRIITFIPTYSGVNYPEYNIIISILTILMITLSLQTKLGEKVSILVERLNELWNGKSNTKTKTINVNGKQVSVKVSQPISGQTQQQYSQSMNQTAMNQAMYADGTSINSLPTDTSMPAQSMQAQSMPSQSMPNYNNMYRQDTTPLIDASSPGMAQEPFVPMAANEGIGGAFGGSSFW